MHTIAIDDDLMPPPCGSAGAENQARRNAGDDEEIDVARKPGDRVTPPGATAEVQADVFAESRPTLLHHHGST